jgi:endonuclease/exonuclease/phosphatase (EEP) superfamily protein YafD
MPGYARRAQEEMLRPRAEPERRSGWPARRIAGAIAVLAATLVPWSWFVVRDLSPEMDLIAVGLPAGALALAIVAFAIAVASSRPYASAVALSMLLFVIVAVVEPRTPERSDPPDRPFRLVAANVFQGNGTPREAVAAIVDADPQLVVVVEAPKAAFDGLVQRLPDHDREGNGEIAVFSAWPLGSGTAVADVSRSSAMRVEVLRRGAPFVVYAIHLSNPLHETTFARQAEVVRRLIVAAEREELPVVLAGDFNLGDRSRAYRMLHDRYRDAMRSTWASSTYDQGPWIVLQLRIDHVFVGDDLCSSGAKVLPLPGSDHDALRVQLGACR